jgi:streptogramin lyase
MHRRLAALTIVLGMVFFLTLGIVFALDATVIVEEADLNPSGTLAEIHRSPDGQFVISDWNAGEIWLVDPDTDAYTVYEVGTALDAKVDGAGNLWWTDGAWTFGTASTSGSVKTTWALTDSNLWGVSFDAEGHVWLSEYFGSASNLLRFNPATTELCTYTLPNAVWTYYLLDASGQFWLLNWGSDEVVRFDPATLAVWSWDVGTLSSLEQGIALDADARLWWADRTSGQLSQLDPDTDRRTDYALPVGSSPRWLRVPGSLVWYTEDADATVGALNPALAAGTVSTLTHSIDAATESCDILGPGTQEAIATRTGTLSWATGTLSPVHDAGGWTVYQLPDPAEPFGLVSTAEHQWVTDPGRQKLVRIASGPAPAPNIDLEKYTNGQDADQAPGPSIVLGQPVTWTYRVENTGNVELTGVKVVDDNGTPGDDADDYTCTTGNLAAGAVDETCEQSGTASLGQYANQATATAAYGTTSVSDVDRSHYLGIIKHSVFLPLVQKSVNQ